MTSLTSIIESEFNNFPLDDDQEIRIRYITKKQKFFCTNCGQYSHLAKKCPSPITSIGIINLYLEDIKLDTSFKNKYIIFNVKEKHKHVDNNYKIKQILLSQFNIKNDEITNEDINEYIEKVLKKVKVLMICRKNSIGYIEFVRGIYDANNIESIIKLLKQMTPNELKFVQTNNFNTLWHNLWNGKYDMFINMVKVDNQDISHIVDINNLDDRIKDRQYLNGKHKEYTISKDKFDNIIKNGTLLSALNNDDIIPKYEEPEWGFPKGKRNAYETNIECALREFNEETQLKTSSITILDRLIPLSESLCGTNDVSYKHTYFISVSKLEQLQINEQNQAVEIGNIGWFTLEEALKMIRPYHAERIEIINMIVKFIAHNLRFYASYNLNLMH